MLSKRVTSALIMVPLFAALAYLGGPLWGLFVLAFMLQAGYEYGRLLKGMGYAVSWALCWGDRALYCPGLFLLKSEYIRRSGPGFDHIGQRPAGLAELRARRRLSFSGLLPAIGRHGVSGLFRRLLHPFAQAAKRPVVAAGGDDPGLADRCWRVFRGIRWGRHKILPRLSPRRVGKGMPAV